MKKLLIALLTLSVLLVSCNEKTDKVNKAANPLNIKYYNAESSPDVVNAQSESNKPVLKIKEEKVESVKEENKRPIIEGLPKNLTDKILDYLYEKAEENNLSYTFLLALAKTESGFQFSKQSNTDDVGLFQLHKPTAKWAAEQLGLKTYNLHDPFTNIDMAVLYICSLRDAWDGKGLSDEDLFDCIVISYNRGVSGAVEYIKKYGVSNNKYLQTVLKNKEELESRMIVE